MAKQLTKQFTLLIIIVVLGLQVPFSDSIKIKLKGQPSKIYR